MTFHDSEFKTTQAIILYQCETEKQIFSFHF